MACIYPYTFPGHITLPGCLSKQLVAWHIQYTPWCLEVPLLGQAVGVLDKIREQNLTSLAVIFVSSVFFMKEVQRKHYPILLHAHSCSDDILLHYHYHTTPLSILILLLIVISCFFGFKSANHKTRRGTQTSIFQLNENSLNSSSFRGPPWRSPTLPWVPYKNPGTLDHVDHRPAGGNEGDHGAKIWEETWWRNFDGKISPQHKLVHAKCMQHA